MSSAPAHPAEPSPQRTAGDACPGTLRLHGADDGLLARVRIPAGLLTAAQAETLADAAQRFGDGHLDITSRGNVQLRGLGEGCAGGLADLLDGAGLLPAPEHERIRNVVASPLTGLDDHGHLDVRPLVRRFDALLCASEQAPALSGRFLFAFDDGRGDVAALDADVTLLADRDGRHLLLSVGAGPHALRVSADDAPHAALTGAEAFLAAARASGTRAWRVAELPPEHALSAPAIAPLLDRAGIAAEQVAAPARTASTAPAPGLATRTGGPTALHVLPPLGRFTAHRWRLLTALAEREGDGELRVTPWRGTVVPGLPEAAARRAQASLADAGLVTRPDSPWLGVGACTGRPGCVKSLADVRADAEATVRAGSGGLPVYWSGCERRCGHPRGTTWVDVVATGDGYDLSLKQGSGTHSGDLPVGHGVRAPGLKDVLAAARTPTTDVPEPTP